MNFLFQITPMAIWECISWLPGFIGKMRRNENDFFLEVSCVKNYHFFSAPRWSEKALFRTIFFSLNIDSDHRSLHLGWFIRVFWEFMVKKWSIFQHNDILRNFRIQTFLNFEFFVLNHSSGYLWVYFMAPRVHWQKAKKWEWFFFWRCHVWKITIFSQPRGGQKRHFFAQFFFSEYRLWSQVGASGVVYLSFLRMYGEKNDKFSSTMTY